MLKYLSLFYRAWGDMEREDFEQQDRIKFYCGKKVIDLMVLPELVCTQLFHRYLLNIY